jgi:hypothetical protein
MTKKVYEDREGSNMQVYRNDKNECFISIYLPDEEMFGSGCQVVDRDDLVELIADLQQVLKDIDKQNEINEHQKRRNRIDEVFYQKQNESLN